MAWNAFRKALEIHRKLIFFSVQTLLILPGYRCLSHFCFNPQCFFLKQACNTKTLHKKNPKLEFREIAYRPNSSGSALLQKEGIEYLAFPEGNVSLSPTG